MTRLCPWHSTVCINFAAPCVWIIMGQTTRLIKTRHGIIPAMGMHHLEAAPPPTDLKARSTVCQSTVHPLLHEHHIPNASQISVAARYRLTLKHMSCPVHPPFSSWGPILTTKSLHSCTLAVLSILAWCSQRGNER